MLGSSAVPTHSLWWLRLTCAAVKRSSGAVSARFPHSAPEITASSSEVGWIARGTGQRPTYGNQSFYF